MSLAWKAAFLFKCTCLAVTLSFLAGCAARQAPQAPTPGLVEQAALEATAILERAKATALVRSARASAEALVQPPSAAGEALPALPTARPTAFTSPASTSPGTPTAVADALPTNLPDSPTAAEQVRILSVGFAAEGAYLHIQYQAPVEIAKRWTQGNVYAIAEESGAIFNEIPVMPVIGALFSKPIRHDQPGYIMLVNANQSLKPGMLVTIVLGSYQFEHIPIGDNIEHR
jgi:hypothetical protein